MKTIVENRASVILYNTIKSNNLNKGLFLIPANICPIVPAILMKSKVNFKFYDIESTNLLPDTKYLTQQIKNSNDISAIIYNHTYGIDSNTEMFFKKIKAINKNIFIVDDRCLTIPDTKPKETVADLVLQSTGYSKYIDLSFGGFAFMQDHILYKKDKLNFEKKHHNELVDSFNIALQRKEKFNYKNTDWLNTNDLHIDDKKYFFLINSKLDITRKHKLKLNKIYLENIDNKFQLGKDLNIWRFNISVNNKKQIIKKIFENNLFASSHYQSLVNIFGKGNGKNAELLHSKTINLFNDFRFTEEKAIQISEIVNRYAK